MGGSVECYRAVGGGGGEGRDQVNFIVTQSKSLVAFHRKVVIIPLPNRRFSCALVDNTVFYFCHENVGKRYGHSGKQGF